MHALFVTAHIQPGRSEEEGMKYLESSVLPQLKEMPGLVAGYWFATEDSKSLAVVLFDDEETARQMAEVGLPNAPPHPGATLGAIEVREVVAHT